jgi:hypothetical protein
VVYFFCVDAYQPSLICVASADEVRLAVVGVLPAGRFRNCELAVVGVPQLQTIYEHT